MSEFTFKEIDEEGLETLKAISAANSFNEWMYDRIRPHCSGKILEIGSGIGNISEYFVRDKSNITLSDLRENYLDFLRKNFQNKNAKIINLDIVGPSFEDYLANLNEPYDTVFALNVIEHIERDDIAIKNIYRMLKPGGKVVILVPAYQSLYNTFDKALEHYRRYTAQTMSSVISGAGFDIEKADYFNAAGIAGWWFTGSIMKKETIPQGQMKLYNALVPIFKIVDKVLMNKVGLSTVVIGRKPE